MPGLSSISIGFSQAVAPPWKAALPGYRVLRLAVDTVRAGRNFEPEACPGPLRFRCNFRHRHFPKIAFQSLSKFGFGVLGPSTHHGDHPDFFYIAKPGSATLSRRSGKGGPRPSRFRRPARFFDEPNHAETQGFAAARTPPPGAVHCYRADKSCISLW